MWVPPNHPFNYDFHGFSIINHRVPPFSGNLHDTDMQRSNWHAATEAQQLHHGVMLYLHLGKVSPKIRSALDLI